jgi:6-phosphogluconate dehydrogenase
MKADIGLIGLAVMGENLALNMESKGYTVAVYNRSAPGEEGVVDHFINGRGKGKHFIGTHTIQELTENVGLPRKIMMMVKSGSPVDQLIEQLLPYLAKGDVVIDGGNSDFHDTARRVKYLEEKGIHFVGSGISGGEEGALNGPSIMPGGAVEAWPLVKDILQNIAAKIEDGSPCCEWIGGGAAGHFVKTVHNGIEYGDMQLISESYALMKHSLGMDNDALSGVFEEWNNGELNSFLIQITAEIFRHRDDDGSYLIDHILDVAGQKGTGKWSAIAALDESNPMTLITEAVYARSLSALQEERTRASAIYPDSRQSTGSLTTEEVRDALYAAKIVSYAQGFSLLSKASEHYGWGLELGTIARIWRNGCIIRSAFLQKITEAYEKNPQLQNLLFDDFFAGKIKAALPAWRKVVAQGALGGTALPAMAAALTYFDGLRTVHSSANLIQAQRDFFGAHTYERTDRERGKFFHTNWTGKGGNTVSGTYNA